MVIRCSLPVLGLNAVRSSRWPLTGRLRTDVVWPDRPIASGRRCYGWHFCEDRSGWPSRIYDYQCATGVKYPTGSKGIRSVQAHESRDRVVVCRRASYSPILLHDVVRSYEGGNLVAVIAAEVTSMRSSSDEIEVDERSSVGEIEHHSCVF